MLREKSPGEKASRVKIKICGITNLEDALFVQASGADALGFVFYPSSPRYIRPEEAKEIISRLDERIIKVGVFVNPQAAQVKRIAGLCSLDILQFHGEESPDFCRQFPSYQIVKAFRVKDKDSLKRLRDYRDADYYLFDAFSQEGFGGTGKGFNWELLKEADIDKPFFLSGGLTPANVAGAIKAVCPDWVDVSSGVEKSPGIKDKKKIKDFIERVYTTSAVSITFCGGARTVTGSMHLIEAEGERVVIDCGLFQGHRDEACRVNSQFPFNPAIIDAAIVSHSHIDHCGNIPNLVKRGFKNKIYATRASRDLMDLMLLDSAKIQEEDIRFVNKLNSRKGLPLRAPLYTIDDAQKALKKVRAVDYHQRVKLTANIHCAFYDSGHILGSGIPFLEIGPPGQAIRIAYAVDLGRQGIPLLADPEVLSDVDYLIIESTYGGRLHKPIAEAKEKLAGAINRTVARGGKVIIPAFALERTQEVVYYLGQLLREKRIKPVPIYVDSPLACNITDVFLKNSLSLDAEARALIEKKADPLGLSSIRYIRDVEESKRLNSDKSPMIIISTSGMCESGRILHHLRNNIEDEKNTILVVGYMAKNTLGKRIVERNKRVKIFGESFALKAEVEVINAFSAHADKNDLVDYVKRIKGRLKKIFVVHGDVDQSEALAVNLRAAGFRPYIPKKMEKVELN